MNSHQKVIDLLRDEVKKAGNQKNFAEKHGICKSTLSLVISGQMEPSATFCKIVGYKKIRETRYIPA